MSVTLAEPRIQRFLGTKDVTVQGRAEFLADGPLTKYDPRLERIWGGREMPPNRVMFRITPTYVKDWGLA